jgi:hypothetical protein
MAHKQLPADIGNRLQSELQRLYLPDAPDGQARAMVLELAGPASWDRLAKVWHGVQLDLDLPAPAIAVSGIDGYQLWFSLAEPVATAQAFALIDLLRRRYLGDVAQERIGMNPSGPGPGETRRIAAVPPVQTAPGRWSAFVAPDLAGVFADEPWLDLPPSPDAQADVLSRLKSMQVDDLKRALERPVEAAAPATGSTQTGLATAANRLEPRGFLLWIMNDPAIELHLRIEAAKALLPYVEGGRK